MGFRFSLTEQEAEQCRQFAQNSAPTQREYRSGGSQQRNVGLIASDTQRGKVGEVVVKKFLEQEPLCIQGINLDFDIYPRSRWDKTDIEINGKKIAIKSAKWFSRWLLLETKDINRDDVYDYYILVLADREFDGGEIAGYATKQEIIESNPNTRLLRRGECIPGTSTRLDAANHARHRDNLRNSESDWTALAQDLRG